MEKHSWSLKNIKSSNDEIDDQGKITTPSAIKTGMPGKVKDLACDKKQNKEDETRKEELNFKDSTKNKEMAEITKSNTKKSNLICTFCNKNCRRPAQLKIHERIFFIKVETFHCFQAICKCIFRFF